MASFEHILIAGCNGRFGRVFARKLAPEAGRLTGVDLGDAPLETERFDDYLRASVAAPEPALLERVAEADLVLLCVPETAVLSGLDALLTTAPPGGCLADIASVKTRIAAQLGTAGGAAGYLGLHPMFAPTERFSGQNFILVPLRESAAADRLEALVRTWQVRATVLTAEEHDRLAASVQVIPHAALLAIGAALRASGADIEKLDRIATPLHGAALSLLARVLRGGDETYWSIQTDNPHAGEARARLKQALEELDSIVEQGDDAAFGRLVDRIGAFLGDASESLAARAERVVDVPGIAEAHTPPESD